MSRQIAGWTVALALIAVVWALAGLVFQAGDPFARLKAPEVRIETYWRATPEAPAHFRLLGGERTLKLVTHAILPPGDPAPPDRVVLFDVGLSLMTLDGQLLWRGIIRTSGRRSVDPAQRGEQPDAWLPDQPNRPVLDSRMLQFEIPMTIPPESRLLVEAVGVDALAVRLYARGQPEGDVVVRARELVFDDAEPLITDRLAPPQPFLRRPGEGAGIQVARTGNRRPFDENEAKVRTPLDPLRPLALNVIGPTQLTLSVWGDPDATGATEATGRVIIGDVPTERPIERFELAVPPPGGRPSAQAFLVPPGVHSLRLSSNVPALVRLAGPLGGGARFGDVPVVVDEGAELMLPDERRFALFIARPDALPVEVATVGPEADDLARLMRIDARLLAAGPDLSPCTVNVEFVDGTDTPQIEQLEVNAPRAPFELVETPAGERLRVSEPQSFRLAVAPSVTALRITADQPVAVRPQVLFPTPPPHLALPYRLHQPPEMIWRYALRDFRNWHPVNPTNRAALREGDQVFTLIPQARLELRGDGDGSEDPELRPGRFQAIEPLGRPPQQAVFESVAPENVGTVRARFGPGVYSAVPFGREVNLRIAAGDAARPRLRVLVEGEASRALGHGLEVFIDGESVAMVPISATRESRTLPPLTAGVHRFEVRGDVPAEAVDLYVDRRVDGVRVVQARTLYALDRRHLRVRVPMPGGRAVTLNAIVYDRDRKADAGTVVRAVIDEGQPRRRLGEAVGTVTLAEKIETLPAARTPLTVARLIDRRGESAGHPRTVPIHLGADLAPGPHLVDIWLEKGSPKWVRFIIADELLTEGERARTRTFTETKGRR